MIRKMLAKGVQPREIASKLGVPPQYVYTIKFKDTKDAARETASPALPIPVPTKSGKPRGRPPKKRIEPVLEAPPQPTVLVPSTLQHSALPFGIEATPPQPGIFNLIVYKIRQWLMK